MVRWKIKLSLLVLSVACGSFSGAQEPEQSHHSSSWRVISPACATPLQTTTRDPFVFQTSSLSESATNGHHVYEPVVYAAPIQSNSTQKQTARSQAQQNEPRTPGALKPGLNTQSIELEIYAEAEVADRELYFVDSLDVQLDAVNSPAFVTADSMGQHNFKNNMLQPLADDDLNVPKKHELDLAIQPTELAFVGQTTTMVENETNSIEPVADVSEINRPNNNQNQPIEPDDTIENDPNEFASETATNDQAGLVFNFSDVEPIQDSSEESFDGQDSNNNFIRISDSENFEIPADTSSVGLIIHPPMIQPYNKHQHTFVVENRGSNIAKEVMVEISVPENAKIVATLPINSVHSRETAVFKFEEIAAGDQVQIHINAVSTEAEPIAFVANLVTKSTYQFDAEGNNSSSELKYVSYNLSPESGNVSLATVAQPVHNDTHQSAVLVRNPFVRPQSAARQQINDAKYNSYRR